MHKQHVVFTLRMWLRIMGYSRGETVYNRLECVWAAIQSVYSNSVCTVALVHSAVALHS